MDSIIIILSIFEKPSQTIISVYGIMSKQYWISIWIYVIIKSPDQRKFSLFRQKSNGGGLLAALSAPAFPTAHQQHCAEIPRQLSTGRAALSSGTGDLADGGIPGLVHGSGPGPVPRTSIWRSSATRTTSAIRSPASRTSSANTALISTATSVSRITGAAGR